ncbi:MAG: glutamate 5-kinase [Acidimicrobiia bacterium]|nr:MAG: glutamate 5-kinase [Acidimicrobiia bacterium]
MRRPTPPGSTVVMKVGSSSLTRGGVGIDPEAVARTVDQVESAWRRGHPTVLVSSGAVAAGLPALGLDRRPRDVPGLQVAAAVGQSRLMERYTAEFARRGRIAGQVLLTKSVLADRDQYLHAREALGRMLAEGIVPVVNENDTVAVEELRLGDNDRLAALVSHLVDARLLLLLTDTAGLLTADPRSSQNAELVSAVRHTDELLDRLARGGSGPLGSGGVATKVAAARMAAWSGIPTVIAAADIPGVVESVLAGEEVGTWVDPHPQRLPARKLWIAFGQPSEGRLVVDQGAVDALLERGKSLLPVGIVQILGSFGAGAAVEIQGPSGRVIGKGLTRYDSERLRGVIGKRTWDEGIEEAVHRDDLVVFKG